MTKGRSRLLDSSQIPSVLKVEHDVGVGGHVLAVMLNPRTRGANSDLPPPVPDDILDLPCGCLPHLKPNDGGL